VCIVCKFYGVHVVMLCVYLVAGVGGLKNVAQRNVKPDLLCKCPPTAD
jgi:hypothetical protein